MKRLLVITFKASCTAIVIAVLSVGAFLLLAGTEEGKALISSASESFLKKKGLEVARVGKIRGDFPWAFGIDELFLRWSQGGIAARDITFKWRPLELLSSTLHVDQITIGRLEILGKTGEQHKKSEQPLDPFRLLGALRHLRLEGMQIASLSLPEGMEQAGREFTLFLKTSASGEAGEKKQILLEAAGTTGTMLKTRLSFSQRALFLQLDTELRDPAGGPVSKKIANGGPVELLLEGRGPIQDWHGTGLIKGVGILSNLETHAAFSLSHEPGNPIIQLTRLILRNRSMQLDISGRLSLQDFGLQGNYRFNTIEPHTMMDLPFDGGLEARGVFSGKSKDITVTGTATAREVVFKEFSARTATMAFKFNLPSGRGNCAGTIRGLGSRAMPQFHQESIEWKIGEIALLRDFISFQGLHISGDFGKLDLSGKYPSSEKTLSLKGNIYLRELDRIPLPYAGKLPYRLACGFDMGFDPTTGAISGSIEGKAERIRDAPHKDLPQFLRPDWVSFNGRAALEGGKRLLIKHVHIKTPEISLTGSAVIDAPAVEADWRITVEDGAALFPMKIPFLQGPMEAEGDLRGRYPFITMKALLKTKDLDGDLKAKATATGLEGGIGLKARHNGRDIVFSSALRADRAVIGLTDLFVELSGASLTGSIDIDRDALTLSGTISGRADEISSLAELFSLEAKGKCSFEASLKASGNRQAMEARLRGEGVNLKGLSVPGLDVALTVRDAFKSPSVKGSVWLKEAQFKGIVGLGTEASFSWDGQAVSAKVKSGSFKYGDIEVSVLSPMDLRLGTDFFSIGTASLEMLLPLAREKKRIPLGIELEASGGRGTLSIMGSSRGNDESALEVHIETPLQFSMRPFALVLPEHGKLEGYLKADVDLAALRPLLRTTEQEAAGRISCFMTIKGTPIGPILSGDMHLKGGVYSYPGWGLHMNDITAEAVLSENALEIIRLKASDGNGGTIGGSGRVKIIPWGRPDASLRLVLERFKAVNLDEARITVSGDLTALWDSGGLFLGGRLSGGPVELSIPRRGIRTVEEIQVLEIPPAAPTLSEAHEKKDSPGPPPIGLGLELEIPGRMFLRGRGLESEWEGSLSITGSLEAPQTTGLFRAVRGRFNLLGKRFDLKEGEVRIDGTSAPSVHINAVAQTRSAGITAVLRISGTLASPLIELTSDPPFPQDEILARVLFGRDLTRITPLQAIALADAALALRGGGGLDVVGRVRRLLGVDDIEIKVSEKGANPSVGVGKYLGEKLFLRLESGIEPESSKASVQMELTPNMLLESEVGADAQGGLGIIWRWDY